jgi:cyanophycinase
MAAKPGPVALVGSGEFLETMKAVDSALLAGRPKRAIVIPTASALEGDGRSRYWLDLGRRHYEGMGVEAVGLDVRTREDAERVETVASVEGAGIVYLSGGHPGYLVATLQDTPLWAAVVAAWREGAALAGCSAGAMALTAGAPPDIFAKARRSTPSADHWGEGNGLGLLPELTVIPHFDQMERWRPGAVERFAAWQPTGTTLVGIDEETALVGTEGCWLVQGNGSVWILSHGGRTRFRPGAEVPLPAVFR